MKADVMNMQGEKVKSVELPAEIFEAPIKVELMHQAFLRQQANARWGTHSTKTRSEVRGGGRKPWRQKGTGRARQGSIRAAQWVGGGKIHTPKPRDYRQRMPKKMRRAALRSALSAKAASGDILLLDVLEMVEPKTKVMATMLERLIGAQSALILLAQGDVNVEKSTRNLPDAKTLRAQYINVRDVLAYDRLVMPLTALESIQGVLGTEQENGR